MAMDDLAAGMSVDVGGALGTVRIATCRPPVLGPAVVSRPGVVEALCAVEPGTVVSMCAPAGYGKTTTAALWERADPRPFVWMGLDRLDDDPSHLVAHLAIALAAQGLVDPEDVRFLSGPGRSPLGQLVPALAEILEPAPPFVVVVDDVHAVTAPEAVAVVGALVEARPGNCVVALLSRTHRLPGTARRRLTDSVVEVGPADLAFDLDEARQAFAGLHVAVDEPELVELVERCEGWAGGLHLAALARRERGPGAPITGRDRLVAEYLVEEVLDGLDPGLVTFLEEASLVSPMSAELLDTVLGRHDSGRRLAEVEASGNLFLVPLDDDAEWYRFHPLFRDLLEARLRRAHPERWRAVHAAACDVLLAAGDVAGAVHHAAAGGDLQRAAALVQRDAVALALSGRGTVLARRLALLPERTLTHDANAAVARGWQALARGDVAGVRGAIADATAARPDQPLADGSASVSSAVALMRAFLGEGGLDGVRAHASTVIEAGDRWSPVARAVRASAAIQSGRLEEARLDLVASLEGAHPVPGIEAGALELLGWLAGREGDLTSSLSSADAGHRLAVRHQLQGVVPVLVLWSLDALAAARAGQQDRARESADVAEQALLQLGHEVPRTAVFNHQLLAEAHHLLGEGADARRHLQEAVRAHRRQPLSDWFDDENRRLAELLDRGPAGTSLAITPLTTAERRLLPYLATHLSLPQIAGELHISRNTVKTHCVSIYRKLGVASRAGAVAEARRLGLIPA